jgi:uncharacterized protein DUF4296
MRTAACLLVLAFLFSCSNKDKVPSGIIPREQMSSILWDMVQADQYSDVYMLKDSLHTNVKTQTMQLYLKVFQLHKVSLEEFRKSMRFYLEHPDLTRSLFDTVINKGNRQRSESFKSDTPAHPVNSDHTVKPGSYGQATPPSPPSPSHGRGAVIPTLIPGHPSAGATPGAGIPGRHLPLVAKPAVLPDSTHKSSHKKTSRPSVKLQ